MYSFEKLQTWQEARKLVVMTYKIVSGFPSYERFDLGSEMRRACFSIASNVAEGSARVSKKDQAHFYNIAFSSCIELLNQFIISTDLGFCTAQQFEEIKIKIDLVCKLINGLRKSILFVSNNQQKVIN
jgi:four helix bundle protein